MSRIIKNNIEYCQKISANDASEVLYDNTESELISDTVQNVVNELSDKYESVQSKMNECLQSIDTGKALIASAITDKKIETASDSSFETLANNIESIALGSGNAVVSDVLSGKTFTNDDGIEYTGTMTNNGAVSKTITPSTSAQSYTVPAGYHNGSGKVTVKAAPVSLINGDAAVGQVLSGKTFFSDSYTAKTGTMTNNGAVSKTITPSTSAQTYTVPAGYHNGSGKVTVKAATLAPTSQSGSFVCRIYSSQEYLRRICFSKPFAKVPTITLSSTGWTAAHKLTAYDVSIVGFTLGHVRTEYGTSNDVTISWTAKVS